MSGSTHFIGVGGTGLSAIARVLLERGETVTGSDKEDSALALGLALAGVRVTIGHDAHNVNGATRVIRSSAVDDNNVEVRAALDQGLPVYKRADFLGELLADQQVIAVAGSHGKTTTSAMIAWILTALNQHCGYILGSVSKNLGANAAAGAGRLFVIEADEYDYMFLGLSPKIALLTNVEHDHPDLFPTSEAFADAFRKFVDRVQPNGNVVGCLDDRGAAEILDYARSQSKETVSYAHSHTNADYAANNLRSQRDGYRFEFAKKGHALVEVSLQVPGMHNVLNATGALVVADLLDLPLEVAALALADFRGTGRRFEVRGEAAGVTIVDDYAHHPTEIRSTLAAARERFPGRRIWALWQPHTYSRTTTLFEDYRKAFENADKVLVTNVYAARENKPADFEMRQLVAQINHPNVQFSPNLDEARGALVHRLERGDVLIVMSAGDAIQISAEVYEALSGKEQADA
ncbi:MAG: UDP-N-acetylmuramate--L-alanine ligase [Anaerolineales bacterium]